MQLLDSQIEGVGLLERVDDVLQIILRVLVRDDLALDSEVLRRDDRCLVLRLHHGYPPAIVRIEWRNREWKRLGTLALYLREAPR